MKVITWSVFRKCRSYYVVLGVATDSILVKCFGNKVLYMKFPQLRITDKPIDVFVGISLYNFSNNIHFNIKYIYLFGRCHSILKDNFLVLICFTKV